VRSLFSSRSRLVAFLTATALTLAGFAALATVSSPASAAGPTPGVSPDFVLQPGQSVTKTFQKPLVGSAEVRPSGPDDCRNNPVLGLTCAAHRIKLSLAPKPGYYLRISTSWLSQSAAATSVPDIDTYLFYTSSSSYTNAQVGGTTGDMPEQMKLNEPKQSEYDVVIGAYAGAVTGYTIVVEYLNAKGSSPTPAKADIVLTPGGKPFVKTVNSALVGYTGAPALYPVLTWAPDDCRNDPTKNALCDVYRIKLHRDPNPDAINFVVIELTWDASYTPDLALVAAGTSGLQVPNLDLILWDTATHKLDREVVGGQESAMPERAAISATQDEYDVVVQLQDGATTQYTIRAYLSNEIFDKPFESLEQLDQSAAPDNSGDAGGNDGFFATPDASGDTTIPGLDLAPINADPDIAGIGLGVDEQFNGNQIALGGATRNTAAVSKAPSGMTLVLALGIVPIVIGVLLVGGLRRRRHAMF
jgi:hypothetical protein